MASIVLKNAAGTKQVYSNINKIVMSDLDGNNVEFTEGGGSSGLSWYFKDIISSTPPSFSGAFSHNGINYIAWYNMNGAIFFAGEDAAIKFYDVTNQNWAVDVRTVIFEMVPTGNVLTWLQTNAISI